MMFWPLSVSTTWQVKNDYAHVIMQDIYNRFIEIKMSVGYGLWFGCDANYDNNQSTPNDSNSSIDITYSK